MLLFTCGVNGVDYTPLLASVEISENQWFSCIFGIKTPPLQSGRDGSSCVLPAAFTTHLAVELAADRVRFLLRPTRC